MIQIWVCYCEPKLRGKKVDNWVERFSLSNKDKFPGAAVSKGHIDSLLEHKKQLLLISLKKTQL